MNGPIAVNDLVVLRKDIGDQNIKQGRIYQVAEVFSDREFGLVWTDRIIRLNLDQVIVFRPEAIVDEEKFWELIEATRAESGGDNDYQIQLLVNRLAAMPVADIISYGEIFNHLRNIAYKRELWTAAVILGADSDDSFADFRAWLIAQGKQIFYDALCNPDILANVVENESVELEQMNYVDFHAYEQKTGEEGPGFLHIEPRSKLTGDWLDEVRCEKFPSLMRKFRPGRCNETP